MSGWFKLYREIREHWIYRDAEHLKVWIEMLSLARHSSEPTTDMIEGQLVEINYAEFIFGRKRWSDRLGISEQRLRTLLKKMIDDDMIEIVKTFSKFTLYRVKNYHEFNQQINQQPNQQVNQHSNQQEPAPLQAEMELGNQQDNHDNNHHDNQQRNQQITSKQPADNQQVTTKEELKNVKNEKKERKDKKIKYADDVSMTEKEYQTLVQEHGEERTKRMIEILDNYKVANGKRYKSDYRAILNWVVSRLAQEESKRSNGTYKSLNTGKPVIPIVPRDENKPDINPAELERARELARRLDANRKERR